MIPRILRPEPIPTVKRPQAPDYPEPGPRGYMRERFRMTQVRAAAALPDRPGRVARRKNMMHSTHWTVPARRARTMTRMHLFAVMGGPVHGGDDLTANDRREVEMFASFLRDADAACGVLDDLREKWGGYMDGAASGPGGD